jgi:type VI protein secretion system component Hcp
MKKFTLAVAVLLLASPVYAQTQMQVNTEATSNTGSVRVEADLRVKEQSGTSDSSTDASMQAEDSSKPATTGIEHEDIGIKADDGVVKELDKSSPKLMEANANAGTTDGTKAVMQNNQSDIEFLGERAGGVQMNKADLIAELETKAAIFIKLGDIKGESKDESSETGGNGDVIIVGGNTSTSGSKPKEIVVVGSKVREAFSEQGIEKVTVRGWDPEKKEEVQGSALNESDLGLLVAVQTVGDENIEEVTLNFAKIKVEYSSEGKLFGFIPISYLIDVTAERSEEIEGSEYGRVKVRFPWYRAFMSTGLSRSDIEAEIKQEIEVSKTESELAAQARVFITISNILKVHHDTAMAIIRKIG